MGAKKKPDDKSTGAESETIATEQQPEKQPEQQPEQQPEKQPEQQPEQQPEKQPEKQPEQQQQLFQQQAAKPAIKDVPPPPPPPAAAAAPPAAVAKRGPGRPPKSPATPAKKDVQAGGDPTPKPDAARSQQVDAIRAVMRLQASAIASLGLQLVGWNQLDEKEAAAIDAEFEGWEPPPEMRKALVVGMIVIPRALADNRVRQKIGMAPVEGGDAPDAARADLARRRAAAAAEQAQAAEVRLQQAQAAQAAQAQAAQAQAQPVQAQAQPVQAQHVRKVDPSLKL